MSRHAPFLIVFLSVVVCTAAACSANPYLNGSKPHFAGAFRNVYPHPEKGGFWKWKWEQWSAGLGTRAWLADLGITNVVEMDWWQRVEFMGLDLHFVPVQHWSKRTLFDENQRLWGAWVVRQPAFSFYFAGDTGYSMDFAGVGRRFGGFDLAAIPIGGYEPRWFMQIMHVNPEESVRIHRDVKSRASLGIHWGTFDDLTDESLYEPPRVLAEEARKAGLAKGEFFVLRRGETRRIARQ